MGAGMSSDAVTGLSEYRKWSLNDVKRALNRAYGIGLRRDERARMFVNRRQFLEVFSDPTVLTKGGGHLTLPLSMYELFKQQLPLSRRASTISQHDAHEAATGAPTAGAPTVAASRRASLTREAARTASSRPASGPGPTGGRRKGRQRDVPLFYSDCGEVVHVPMVIFDDRGRPAHSYFEDDVNAGKYNFLYPNQASAAMEVVTLQEDVVGRLATGHGSEGVDAIMVVLVLALFCRGDSDDQLELAFRSFDADNSNDMDRQEMRDFVTCLSRAAFKIGIVKKRVPRAAVRKLADEMFAVAKRGGGDHGISAQDFVDWARAHVVGQALVKSMESLTDTAAAPAADPTAKVLSLGQIMRPHGALLQASKIVSRERDAKLQAKRALAALSESTQFRVEELASLRHRFIVAAQESKKARKASVVSLQMASEKLETLQEANRLLNTVPPEQRANMIADATAELEKEKKNMHALAKHAADMEAETNAFKTLEKLHAQGHAKSPVARFKRRISGQPASGSAASRKRSSTLSGLDNVDVTTPSRLGGTGADYELTRDQFVQAMEAEMNERGVQTDAVTLNALFSVFDRNGSGKLDFREFTVGFARLTAGSIEDKISLMFDCFDRDGDGTISMEELLTFVDSENGDMLEDLSFIADVVQLLDKDGDGSLSRDEFAGALLEEPMLFDCFVRTLNIPGLSGEIKAEFTDLKKSHPKLRMSNLKLLWKTEIQRVVRAMQEAEDERPTTSGSSKSLPVFVTMGSGSNVKLGPGGTPIVSKGEFFAFMKDRFDFPLTSKAYLNAMYECVKHHKGISFPVEWKDVFLALAQVLGGGRADVVNFFFDLYDLDGSGDVSREEVTRMLMLGKAAANSSAATVAKLLQRLDIDGDGEIDFKEFHSGLTRDRELMEFFGRMFGVTSINVEEFSSSEEEEDEGDDGAGHSGSEESGSQHGADTVSGGGNDGQVHVMEVSTAATPRKPRPKPVIKSATEQMLQRKKRGHNRSKVIGGVTVGDMVRLLGEGKRVEDMENNRGMQRLRKFSLGSLREAVAALQLEFRNQIKRAERKAARAAVRANHDKRHSTQESGGVAALLEKAGIKGGLVKELPRSINLRKPLPATLAAKAHGQRVAKHMSSQRYALHAEERKQQHRLMLQRFEHNRKEAPPPPPPTRLERAIEKERTMVLPPKQRTKVMKMKPVEAACNPSMRTYSSFAQAAKKKPKPKKAASPPPAKKARDAALFAAPSPGDRWGIHAVGHIDPRTGKTAQRNPDHASTLLPLVLAADGAGDGKASGEARGDGTADGGSGGDLDAARADALAPETAEEPGAPVSPARASTLPQAVHAKVAEEIRKRREPVGTLKARNAFGFEPLRHVEPAVLHGFGQEPVEVKQAPHVERARQAVERAIAVKQARAAAAAASDVSPRHLLLGNPGGAGDDDGAVTGAGTSAANTGPRPLQRSASVPVTREGAPVGLSLSYSLKHSNFKQHMRNRSRHLEQPAERALALLPTERDRLLADAAKTLSPAALAAEALKRRPGQLPDGRLAKSMLARTLRTGSPAHGGGRASTPSGSRRRPATRQGEGRTPQGLGATGSTKGRGTGRNSGGGSVTSGTAAGATAAGERAATASSGMGRTRSGGAGSSTKARRVPALPAAGAAASAPHAPAVRPFRIRAQPPKLASGIASVELDARVADTPGGRLRSVKRASARPLLHFSRAASTGVLLSPVNTSHLPHQLRFSQTASAGELFTTLGYRPRTTPLRARGSTAPNSRSRAAAASSLRRQRAPGGAPLATASLRSSSMRTIMRNASQLAP